MGPGVAADHDEGRPKSSVQQQAEAVPKFALLVGTVCEFAVERLAHIGRVLLLVSVLSVYALIVHDLL